ncbi:hypothetical protein BGZ60DRAFT_433955 [Tricladium varicosporioides]|nr:hypothetical protein BGZ60DRAFT_433955 [Hymenoscyphus varicosporioides]
MNFPNSTLPVTPTLRMHSNSELVGLRNLGNTAWMNTGLQCVRAIHELSSYFLDGRWKSDLNPDNVLGYGGEVAEAYSDLLTKISATTGPVFAPREFRAMIGKVSTAFQPGIAPADAQEFIGFLLDALGQDVNLVKKRPYVEDPEISDNKINDASAIQKLAQEFAEKHKARDNSIITGLCEGLIKDTIKCPTCTKVCINFNNYIFLGIECPVENTWRLDPNLEAQVRDEEPTTLQGCFLETYNKEKLLLEHDAWHCPRCDRHQRALITQELWTTPRILLFHLKKFDKSHGGLVNLHVTYPVEALDISDWVVSKNFNSKLLYDLFAVVNFLPGEGKVGHYLAFTKNRGNRKWYKYNDARVTECRVSEVVTAGAYVLFYRRRDDVNLD